MAYATISPDFKTIADFRKDNGDAIKLCCKQFLLFCQQAGLVGGAFIAIDGSKFKAAALQNQKHSEELLFIQ